MKKFIFALIASALLTFSAYATDITVQSTAVPYAQFAALGGPRTMTVTVTASSTTVTSTNQFPQQLVGVGGWQIEIGGNAYEVDTVTSTSSLKIKAGYGGSSGSTTATMYPVLLLRVYTDKPFTPKGASYVVQPGSPRTPTGFFKQVGCTVKNGQVNIPQLVIPSQNDATAALDKTARFSAYLFQMSGALIDYYQGFSSFIVPETKNPTTWTDIRSFNLPAAPKPPSAITYDTTQVDEKDAALAARIAALEAFQISPVAYGAKGDGLQLVGAINAGSTTVTTTTAQFVDADKDKVIYIAGAGNPTATGAPNGLLKSVISRVISNTQVQIADPAIATVAAGTVTYGTDNTAAFTAAITAVNNNGGGVIQVPLGNFIITQITLGTGTTLRGVKNGLPGNNTSGSQIWSAFGQTGDQPLDGIVRTRFALNSSTVARGTIEYITIQSLDYYQFQTCVDEVGSTYLQIKDSYFYRCHIPVVLDQTELSSVKDNIFEGYDPGRDLGLSQGGHYPAGIDPTLQGRPWGFVGAYTAASVEPAVYPDDCWQCGRWQVNSTSGAAGASYYYWRTLAYGEFAKGFYLRTSVPEVVSFGGGKAATMAIDDGKYRYELRWQLEASGAPLKLNDGATTYTFGLSDDVIFAINPGGATATLRQASTTGSSDTILATVSGMPSTSAGIFWGDLDTTSGYNSNVYWQRFEYEPSWPRSAQLWMPAGDDHWQSRESKTAAYTAGNSTTGGGVRSGDGQVFCPGCAMSGASIGKVVTVVDPSNRTRSVSGTITGYYGDGYVWLTADINASTTTIPVSGDPRYGGRPVYLYFGGEAVYCTGYSSGNLTGCVRGIHSSTASSHTAGDGRTVSVNVYRTWIISTTPSYTIDGDVTYYQAGGPEFVNVIDVSNNQFNGGTNQVVDQGGYTHRYIRNNFNGAMTALQLQGSHEIIFQTSDVEGMVGWPIRIGGPGLVRAATGSPFSVSFQGNSLPGAAVRIEGGNVLSFTDNSFAGGFGYSISNTTAGSVGHIHLQNNQTQGARLLQQNHGGYLNGMPMGSQVPIMTTGGLSVSDWRTWILRPRTGPIDINYAAVGYEDNPRGGLATATAGSTTVTITASTGMPTQLTTADIGKDIWIEYAGTPDGNNSIHKTTIAGVPDANTITLAVAAAQSTIKSNAVWFTTGPKTAAITLRDDYDKDGLNGGLAQNFFRIQGLSSYGAKRTATVIDASGYLGMTHSLLTPGRLPYVYSDGTLADSSNATLDANGYATLRNLYITATGTGSGQTETLGMVNSAGTATYVLRFDPTSGATANYLQLYDSQNNKNVLKYIPAATYGTLEMDQSATLRFTTTIGMSRNTANISGVTALEINNGTSLANSGQLRDALMRSLYITGATSASNWARLTTTSLTGQRTYTFPDLSDTISTTTLTETVSNKTFDTANANTLKIAGTSLTSVTGTGAVVLATGPTMTLNNATGLPISTGVSGLGTGIATWLATPSSANLATALTTKTGSGLAVFDTSPTLVTPSLGVATATSMNVNGGVLKVTAPATINATVAGTTTIDMSTGNIFTVQMGAGNTTITATNVPVGDITIYILQDGTGSRTVTWNALFKWTGGTATTLTTTASARDGLRFNCNGTSCFAAGNTLNLQ